MFTQVVATDVQVQTARGGGYSQPCNRGGGCYVWDSYGEQHLYWRQYYNWHPPYIPRSDMFTRSDMYHTHDPTAPRNLGSISPPSRVNMQPLAPPVAPSDRRQARAHSN